MRPNDVEIKLSKSRISFTINRWVNVIDRSIGAKQFSLYVKDFAITQLVRLWRMSSPEESFDSNLPQPSRTENSRYYRLVTSCRVIFPHPPNIFLSHSTEYRLLSFLIVYPAVRGYKNSTFVFLRGKLPRLEPGNIWHQSK